MTVLGFTFLGSTARDWAGLIIGITLGLLIWDAAKYVWRRR